MIITFFIEISLCKRYNLTSGQTSMKNETINKTYQVVVDDILQRLQTKELSVGSKLPSERELAKHFSISRASVREALSILKSLGLIDIKQGDGAFIKAFTLLPLLDALIPLVYKTDNIDKDILEFRRILEVDACALACSAKDKTPLISIVDKMEERLKEDSSEAQELDMAFHRTIWNMSGNLVLVQAMECIAYLLIHSIKVNRQVLLKQANDRLLIDEHKAILQAIIDRDPDQAKQLMETHLQLKRIKGE